MSYINIFNNIVNEIVDPVIVHIDGQDYPLDMKSHLLTIATNVTLVLEGGRLSYRMELDDKCSYETVSNCDPNLTIDTRFVEPLVYLNKNSTLIDDIFKRYKCPSIGLGKALEYAYIGPKWINGYRDCYIIHYEIIYTMQDTQVHAYLYSFNCPTESYNDNIREKIIKDLEKFRQILDLYDISINVGCALYPKHGVPSPIDLP